MSSMEECSITTIILAIIGILTVLLLLFATIWNVIQLTRAILAPYFLPNEPATLAKKYGAWALVTGSTDGIGKAYAKELARRGLNIVLVSRSQEKLEATAKEIEAEYNVKTKIISADFSNGRKAVSIVRDEIGQLPVGILVNNVGKQYAYPMYLGEVDENDLWDMININVGAVTMMTRLFVGDMQKRGRGAIVNVSSGAEQQPLPLMNVYAATKVYIKNFTEALRCEYSKYGITIQHLSPMFINTKMNKFSDRLQETTWLVPDATTYAKYAVATLGKVDHSTGYWSHGIQYFFVSLAPTWIKMHIGGSMNKSFRRDYFRQQKKLNEGSI